LRSNPGRIKEAKAFGVRTLPAFVAANVEEGLARTFHLNKGADIWSLKD
jgi:hypothetical protein